MMADTPNMSPVDLDGWISYDYIEANRHFTVVQPKHLPVSSDLSADGPLSSLNRNGRFLLPTHLYRDVVMVSQIDADMFEQQRLHLKFRAGDIVVATFPRSGTTWTEQLVLLLLSHGDASHLDTTCKNAYHKAAPHRRGKIFLDLLYHKTPLANIAAPWGFTCGQDLTLTAADIDAIAFRRVLKTHNVAHMLVGLGEQRDRLVQQLPPRLCVDGVKFVWVVRDPKDVMLSLMRVNNTDYTKHAFPVPAFAHAFLAGKTNRGSWARHTKEWAQFAKAHPESVLPLSFEDSKKDPMAAARTVAAFLAADVTEEELEKAVRLSSFDVMKVMAVGSEAPHMHKGEVGGWRSRFTPQMVERFNDMLRDPELGDYGKRYLIDPSEAALS